MMKKMPILLLNSASSVAPYEQISAQIRTLIISDQLYPGLLLPSIRQLASDLGVAPNTIARAYNELEREGLVMISARRNVVVAEYSVERKEEERNRQLKQLVTNFLASVKLLDVSISDLYGEIQRQLEVSSHKTS